MSTLRINRTALSKVDTSVCLCVWGYLRRNWRRENIAILVTLAVNEDGYREVIGNTKDLKEDKVSWVSIFQCCMTMPWNSLS